MRAFSIRGVVTGVTIPSVIIPYSNHLMDPERLVTPFAGSGLEMLRVRDGN